MGMIKRAAEHFYSVMNYPDGHKREHGLKFFEKSKLIFEFFCSEHCLV